MNGKSIESSGLFFLTISFNIGACNVNSSHPFQPYRAHILCCQSTPLMELPSTPYNNGCWR